MGGRRLTDDPAFVAAEELVFRPQRLTRGHAFHKLGAEAGQIQQMQFIKAGRQTRVGGIGDAPQAVMKQGKKFGLGDILVGGEAVQQFGDIIGIGGAFKVLAQAKIGIN